jgi:putative membrane protein
MTFEPSSLSDLNKDWSPRAWIGPGALAVFTLISVAGYWVFALNPGAIPDSDFARSVYGLSFPYFARLHILLAALVLFWFLITHSGLKWVAGFVAVALVSFLSEYLGTGYGFPFGTYEYTGLLGFKLGGRVPALIPVSWFLMALPSWVMAHGLFPSSGGRLPRVILAAYFLTAWDLALDPAMSYLTPYWVWEASGPFYGMPWVNLLGWMGTGVVLMVLLETFGARKWAGRLPVSWMAAYYALILLMPLGMLLAAGLWLAVWVTLGALALGWGGAWLVARRTNTGRGMGALREQVAP